MCVCPSDYRTSHNFRSWPKAAITYFGRIAFLVTVNLATGVCDGVRYIGTVALWYRVLVPNGGANMLAERQ